jgi:hypothetical protein
VSQAHVLFAQWVPDGQTWSQAPQCALLLTTSTHAFAVVQKRWEVSEQPQTPLRQTSVALHARSHAPQ